jgi:histidinol-phosphatase (PHP family)
MKTNFHTHHALCRHAVGICDDYAKAAITSGYEELGFSDHAPKDGIPLLGLRMKEAEFNKYIQDVSQAKLKYQNDLKIYLGVEIEHWYYPDDYYQNLLQDLDYVILGQHAISLQKDDRNLKSSFALSNPEEIRAYGEVLCDAMSTGRYDIVAHPDLFLNGYITFDEIAKKVTKKICECAVKTRTILEYNINGYRRSQVLVNNKRVPPYPRKEFWTIAKEVGVTSILSIDAHNPMHLYDQVIQKAEEEFQRYQLRVVQTLSEIKAYRQGK